MILFNKYVQALLWILLLGLNSYSQPSYLKRLSFNTRSSASYINPADSLLYLRNFTQAADGNSFIHVDIERHKSLIYKVDMSGNILVTLPGAYPGSWRFFISGFHATPDSGLIYAGNSVSYSNGNSGSFISKIDGAGVVEWTTSIPPITGPYGYQSQETFDIALLPDAYVCLATDSAYILNLNGVITGTIDLQGPGKMAGFSNGDILLINQNYKGRLDSSLNLIYTLPPGNFYLKDTLIFLAFGDSLHRINSLNGNVEASFYFFNTAAYKFELLDGGGWIAYDDQIIQCFDSVGNLRWTNHVSLPHFGIQCLGEQSDGTIITGGTYKSAQNFVELDYSSFIATIDSNGNSIMDSTHQVWGGDADNSGKIEFGDALFVALAQNYTGSANWDTAFGILPLPYGNIGVDFQTTFGTGINHQYSDFDQNGIIDSADFVHCSYFTLWQHGWTTPWRITQPGVQHNSADNSLFPFFSCIPESDSAMRGDTVRFYVIVGDNGIYIDSIFGIAYILDFDSLNTWDVGLLLNMEFISNDLCQSGNQRIFKYGSQDINMLLARRDLQNAYSVHDTIAYFDIQVLDSSGLNTEIGISLRYLSAITAGGFPVEMQYNTRPVYLRTMNTRIEESDTSGIEIFPNPVSDYLVLDKLPPRDLDIAVHSMDGKRIYYEKSQMKRTCKIDLREYRGGSYIVSLVDIDNTLFKKKFIVER
jgi:hypothetical protein